MTELQVRSRGPVYLDVDLKAYGELCRSHGITSDVIAADVFGVNRSVATRIRQGVQRPGNPFLAGIADAFGFNAFSTLLVVRTDRSVHRTPTARRMGLTT